MKKIFFLLLFLSANLLPAQKKEQPQAGNDPQNMKVITSREPQYPKGEQALYTEVLYGIKYSEDAKKNYAEGYVDLSFDVLADSTVANVVVMKDVGYGIGEEVKKYVGKLKFIPARQMGVAVKMNVMWSFPVKAH